MERREENGSKEPTTAYEIFLLTPTPFYFVRAVMISFLVMYITLSYKHYIFFLALSNGFSFILVNFYLSVDFFSVKALMINYAVFSILAFLERRPLLKTMYNLTKSKAPKVVLKAWTSQWEQEFKEEKKRLEVVLRLKYGSYFQNIDQGLVHIGSTAIKNIKYAKPMHDIGLFWNSNDSLPQSLFDDLDKLGYFYVGPSFHCPKLYDHWFFYKNSTHDYGFDIHITQPYAHDWLANTVTFCEYLTENEDARKRYEDTKHTNEDKDIAAYTANKQSLVKTLRAEAVEWRDKKQN